jgi:hypothetical protein
MAAKAEKGMPRPQVRQFMWVVLARMWIRDGSRASQYVKHVLLDQSKRVHDAA